MWFATADWYVSSIATRSCRYRAKQCAYSIAFASLLIAALCAGCVNSDKAKSPVSTAISKFLRLFIVEEYFSMDGVATSTVFSRFLPPTSL